MNKCCDYWEIGIAELDRIVEEKYTAEPFNYCPWCGMSREKVGYDNTEDLVKDLDSNF